MYPLVNLSEEDGLSDSYGVEGLEGNPEGKTNIAAADPDVGNTDYNLVRFPDLGDWPIFKPYFSRAIKNAG